MYLKRTAPQNRIREAERARENRAEIVKALSTGEISRRDLVRWGLLTTTGVLACKHGLSPFAKSAYASDKIPTGTPPSPLFGALPYTQPMPRLTLPEKHSLTQRKINGELDAAFPSAINEKNAKRLSWHTEFSNIGSNYFSNPRATAYVNRRTLRGPCEGRPPGEWFAHQRWEECFPQAGYVMSLGQVESGIKFHPNMPDQAPDTVWPFNSGGLGTRGTLPPPLIKVRYGEPVITRIYNNLPINRASNGGFGRNEPSIHNHNAHNGAASDGANNAYFFPGQFYDYHWGTCLARADTYLTDPTLTSIPNFELRASGIDDNGNAFPVPGDFRELQGTLWFHDHRFFFTAENVYKGSLGMLNYYSGPDRGHEGRDDGINHRLPSGTRLEWGNIDFDVNLIISDYATDQTGQLFFDIFDTDGFLGDNLLVNFAHQPYFEVLPRKYRFRLLNGAMARFLKLTLVTESNSPVPLTVIANDGNFLPNPVTVNTLLPQGSAERFDIIVDFSGFSAGDRLTLVNTCEHKDGRGPDDYVTVQQALTGQADDPAVGGVMQFVIVNEVESTDVPGQINRATDPDLSQVPAVLTEPLPVVEPVREREIEFKRGETLDGEECFPDCGEKEAFPWQIRIDGESTHFLNANRSSMVIPRPGEVEHWTLKNGGGGWDHPVHLHFEEGLTLGRENTALHPLERFSRKDVWRLGEGGEVKIQVRFGEYGGAYVTHCHNTVHEDFAMLMRFDVLKDDDGSGDPFVALAPTPDPTPDGVNFLTPEILPEGDPRLGYAAHSSGPDRIPDVSSNATVTPKATAPANTASTVSSSTSAPSASSSPASSSTASTASSGSAAPTDPGTVTTGTTSNAASSTTVVSDTAQVAGTPEPLPITIGSEVTPTATATTTQPLDERVTFDFWKRVRGRWRKRRRTRSR